MVAPNYTYSLSLVDNRTSLQGNIELAHKIEKMAQTFIERGKDLYQAQDEIKSLLIKDFGCEWYEKSGEAVNFIIENEYAHDERESIPLFDARAYEEDIKRNVLY